MILNWTLVNSIYWHWPQYGVQDGRHREWDLLKFGSEMCLNLI